MTLKEVMTILGKYCYSREGCDKCWSLNHP